MKLSLIFLITIIFYENLGINSCNSNSNIYSNSKTNLKINYKNYLSATKNNKKISIPLTLPKYSINSYSNNTQFSDFQILMLNIHLTRIEAREIFHLIDLNKDQVINDEEWSGFYKLFIKGFLKCDADENLLIDVKEAVSCIRQGEKFKNMWNFNTEWIRDEDKLLTYIFNAFDLNMDGFLNLNDYITLRNFNNAYDILLVKESKVYFQNFPVGIHLINSYSSINMNIYTKEDLIRIYNRTLNNAYFPFTLSKINSKAYLDFATFSKIGILLKIFINNNFHTGAYLSYSDLLNVGQFTPTYILLQNYTQLYVKNDMIYENLNKGIHMKNLIFVDGNKNYKNNLNLIKDNTNKISVEQLFLLNRHFETLYSINKKNKVFTMGFENFDKLLQDDLYSVTLQKHIDNSFEDFKKVSKSAGKNFNKNNYTKFIFNILDLNNSTFLEIYELLMAIKACDLYSSLNREEKIYNYNNETNLIKEKLLNFTDYHILNLDRGDQDYIIYLNYKYNSGKINFHQFLFTYLLRLKDTSKLILPREIETFMNNFGFFLSADSQNEFYNKYEIKQDDYLSFTLSMQNYFKFYSDNLVD